MLVRDDQRGDLRAPDGAVPALRIDSVLARLAGDRAEPLIVDEHARRRGPARRLPRADRDWLARGPFRIVVPLVTSDGELTGLIALGDKRSELPFTGEDRRLLTAIAASASLTMENRLLRSSPHWRSSGSPTDGGDTEDAHERAALECTDCLALHAPDLERCPACGGMPVPVPVPLVLEGKFRLERRIGAGGMGVVYRAIDISLGRAVAIKTLPRVSPEFALRLRREARAMASVTHPHLAMIYGAESWRGTPLLIVEYLPGGTLATRIERGPRSTDEIRGLGLELCGVLERLHDVGVLHRDIKPSNIGYTLDGQPKLLDFGLAKMLDDSRDTDEGHVGALAVDAGGALETRSLARSLTVSRTLVGTPAYLPPEAFRGISPSTATDLWATAVVLFEGLTGKHPFLDAGDGRPLERIERAEPLPIEQVRPGCPAAVTALFAAAFALDPKARPPSARALAELIAALPTDAG